MEKESTFSNDLKAILIFILILVSAILGTLLFRQYTILIDCNDWYTYQRWWNSPMREALKLEDELGTGNNCNVKMFAR